MTRNSIWGFLAKKCWYVSPIVALSVALFQWLCQLKISYLNRGYSLSLCHLTILRYLTPLKFFFAGSAAGHELTRVWRLWGGVQLGPLSTMDAVPIALFCLVCTLLATDCSSSVCYLLYVSLSRALNPGEEAVISFESLDLQIEHEPNRYSATVSGLDYSTKLELALEIDLCWAGEVLTCASSLSEEGWLPYTNTLTIKN